METFNHEKAEDAKIVMEDDMANGTKSATEWGSVLSEVIEQLPTMDSDSEVSTLTDDSDNENYIFQRNLESTDSATQLSTSPQRKDVSSDSAALLFQRLDCQAPKRAFGDLDSLDTDFPIYEEDFESCYSESDIGTSSIATSSDALDSVDSKLQSSSTDSSPLLSLQALDSVNLDCLLDDVDISRLNIKELDGFSDTSEDNNPTCNELMAQLEHLSQEQSGASKGVEDVAKEREDKPGNADDAQDHFLEEGHVKKDPGGTSKKTSSCGVSANLPPKVSELTCSEPTTIYLDLRDHHDDSAKEDENQVVALTDKQHPVSRTSVRHYRSTSNQGSSTSDLSALNRSTLTDITEESDSDSEEDDFEKWKVMRNRFKNRSVTSSEPFKDKRATISQAQSLESEALKQPPDDVQKFKKAEGERPALPKCVQQFCASDLTDLNALETKKKLVQLTLKKVKDAKEKIISNGLTNGHALSPGDETPPAQTNTTDAVAECNGVDGIYASQRLKKTTGPAENDPTNKSHQRSIGRTTVLFAEEPRRDSADTTNVYRSKDLGQAEKSIKSATTTPVQTDESFSVKPTTNSSRKSVAELLSCSTEDLRAAVEKVANEKKQMRDNEVKAKRWNATHSRDSYNIVQNQRKQPASDYSTSLTSGLRSTSPSISWENRAKLSAVLQNAFIENVPSEDRKMFPLLYDRDTSFSPHMDTLPPSVDGTAIHKMALLSFQMSAPGCIVHTRTSAAHRHIPVDQGTSFPLTYSLLLSWLLALIPDKIDKPYDPPRADVFVVEPETDPDLDSGILEGKDEELCENLVEVPFNVVSLHQVWQEETQSMVINAVVIPNFFFKPDTSVRRKKPKKENAFYQVVWHFLQSNRIQDVCPWHSRQESPIYQMNEIPITCSTKPMSTYVTASNDPLLIQKALDRTPGFFWKSLPADDQSSLSALPSENNKLETTLCILQRESFTYPVCLIDFIIKLQLCCLDIVGLRLAFATNKTVQKNILSCKTCGDDNEIVPCVSLAIRGRTAIKKVQNLIGPKDPVLARMTDRHSLNATYGEQLSKRRGDLKLPTEMNVFHCPRSMDRIAQQLTVWFGGRFQTEDDLSAVNQNEPVTSPSLPVSTKSNGKGKSKSRSNSTSSDKKSSSNGSSALTRLTATPHLLTCRTSCLCLVVSSRFPPQYIGDVITIASDQGYALEGLKRMSLNDRKVAALCVSPRYAIYFNPPSNLEERITEEYYEIDNWWQRPITVLILARENASTHQAALLSCLQSELMYRMVDGSEQGLLHSITCQCFHVCPFTDAVGHIIGPLCKFPDVELSSGVSPRAFFSDPELEQVVVLTLLGHPMIAECSCILQTLLHGEFSSTKHDDYNSSFLDNMEDNPDRHVEFHGFELLGIKYIPCVSAQHAKELTPFEVGTRRWHDSIPVIKDSPALLCVLRRVNAFDIVRSVLNIDVEGRGDMLLPHSHSLDRLMSSTPEISYRQIKTFFCEKELFADNRCRPLLKYLPPPLRVAQYLNGSNLKSDEEEGAGDPILSPQSPPPGKNVKRKKKRKSKELTAPSAQSDESIFSFMLSWPQPLTSLMIIKPDAFPRHFVKLLRRLHQEGFTVVAARMTVLSEDQASQVIPSKYENRLGERNVFISYLTSSASLVLCVQRTNAVRRLLDVAGPPNPRDALRMSRRGRANWRSEFGIDEFSNAIHVSERYVSACEEQKLFFPEGICCQETLELRMEQIPAPAEDRVMCEDKMKGRQVKFRLDSDIEVLGPSGMEIQPVCVVLSAPIVAPRHCIKRHQRPTSPKPLPPYVEVLEQLLVQGFELCALRMCWFRQHQAELLYGMVGEQCDENRQEMIKHLTSGPSLVILMQRENGLVLFDSVLASCLKKYPFIQHSRNFLRTQTMTQTKLCAKYLFHRVDNHHSIIEIVHKRALEWQERNGIISP